MPAAIVRDRRRARGHCPGRQKPSGTAEAAQSKQALGFGEPAPRRSFLVLMWRCMRERLSTCEQNTRLGASSVSYSRVCRDCSGLISAAQITLGLLLSFSAISLPKSADDPTNTVAPRLAKPHLITGRREQP